MGRKRRKASQTVVCVLAVMWAAYYLLQTVAEIFGLHELVHWTLPGLLTVIDTFLHFLAALLLVATAFAFYAERRSMVLVGGAALVKAVAYFLRVFTPVAPLLELAAEGLCCVLLVTYALCCFEVFHRPSLLLPLEVVLLSISCISSLLAAVEQGVLINHAAWWLVVLAAALEPLGGVVMLLLNTGYHRHKE